MTQLLQQTVHGYLKGHVELSSSVHLDDADSDLLTRLSDLSGALVSNADIAPYLTLYPLPSASYYALATTWPDDEGPRAGCVLTHTILVPMEIWAGTTQPHSFAHLFRKPSRGNLASYRTSLHPTDDDVPLAEVSEGELLDLCSRFFGEGLQPLVWFDQDAHNTITWRIVRALWPSLRSQFSCCTYALKPRSLDDRPFDLLFAPERAASRFSEYARDHVVRQSQLRPAQTDWLSRWVAHISREARDDKGRDWNARVDQLKTFLEPTPTAIRRVMVFLELSERAHSAPMAALGALDALSTLRLPANVVRDDAQGLVEAALTFDSASPPEESVEFLYLLSERVSLLGSESLARTVTRVVGSQVARGGSDVLEKAEELATRRIGSASEVFFAGVGDGLIQRLSTAPSDVQFVLSLNALGRALIEQSPDVCLAVLVSGRHEGTVDAIRQLMSWFRHLKDERARFAVQLRLLPQLIGSEVGPAQDLVDTIEPQSVSQLCEAVERGPAANDPVVARWLAEGLVAASARNSAEWSSRSVDLTYFSALLCALSLEPEEKELSRVLSRPTSSRPMTALIAAVLVERALHASQGSWAHQRLVGDLGLWAWLLAATGDPVGALACERICFASPRSGIARAEGARRQLAGASASIQDYCIRQLVLDWLDGSCDKATFMDWMSVPWVQSRIAHDPATARGWFSSFPRSLSPDSWYRAWVILENLPVTADIAMVVTDAIEHLLRLRPFEWPTDTARAWCQVLHRYESFRDPYLGMCARAFEFATESPTLPVAMVAAASFFPTHQAATSDRTWSWNIFSFFQWDRGLEVRRRLVEAFSKGNWEPRWFVAAAGQPWLLRKLSKRMSRQWRGGEFLERAYAEARSSNESIDPELVDCLRATLSAPYIDEDWD